MNPRRCVLATGYVALDVIRHGDSVRHVAGGTAANVAANLSYLGWGSTLLARLGDDAPFRRIKFDLGKAGVDLAGVSRDDDVETPVVIHEVESRGHRFRFKCPKCDRASSKFRPVELEKLDRLIDSGGLPTSFDVVFVDRVSSASVALLERRLGTLQMLEPSSKGAVGPAVESAELVHILKWSHEVRDDLHPTMLRSRAGQLQIETLGPDGLRFRLGSEPWSRLHAPEVEAVDSAGAGDWLTAAFLAALPRLEFGALSRKDISDALVQGQVVAALSCLYIGSRTLSNLRPRQMRDAAAAVKAGNLDTAPTASNGRRSEPADVCPVCLRPVAA